MGFKPFEWVFQSFWIKVISQIKLITIRIRSYDTNQQLVSLDIGEPMVLIPCSSAFQHKKNRRRKQWLIKQTTFLCSESHFLNDWLHLIVITRVALSSVHTSANLLMKPHLNSLDPDFYLDLHQIAHTHKYQCPKHAWFFFHQASWIIL